MSEWQGLTSVIMVRGVGKEKKRKKLVMMFNRVPLSLVLSCAMNAIWHVFNVEGARNRKESGHTKTNPALPCHVFQPAKKKKICLGIVAFPLSLSSDMVCHTAVEQLEDKVVRLSIFEILFIFLSTFF